MSNQRKNIGLVTAVLLVGFAVAARFLPHSPNFTPMAALALFSAVYLPKKIALIMPLAAMFISDIFIGFYNWPIMSAVYSSFFLTSVLGLWLKKHKKCYNVINSAFLASCLFFFLTNLAVWAFTPWYAKTIQGLLACLTMALPFFKNTLLGNLFYTSCLFGVYELITKLILCRFKLLKKLI